MSRRNLVVVSAAILLVASAGCAGRLRARAGSGTTGSTPTPLVTATSAGTSTTTAPSTRPTTPPTAACAAPAVTLTDGRNTVTTSGAEREYLLALPTPFDPRKPSPVILNFHGSGSDMTQQAAYSQFPTKATARGYIVVTPQGSGTPRGWSLAGGDDDKFVGVLVAAVGRGACVDSHRIFAAGISDGSAYAGLMACRPPYRIAAVGMVAATVPSLCPVQRPMPAVAFAGTADPVVPYGGGKVNGERLGVSAPGAESSIAQWAQRNGCDAKPEDRAFAADVVWRFWSGCKDGGDVAFYSIVGGGHTWPGSIDVAKFGITKLGATSSSISATDVFLDFFDAHSMR